MTVQLLNWNTLSMTASALLTSSSMTPGHQSGRAGRWHVTDTHDDYIGGQPRIVTPEQGIDLDGGRPGVRQSTAAFVGSGPNPQLGRL
jgi:hypothetical protein